MRILASIPTLLALGSTVAAAPAPVNASEAQNWNQTEPIPASAILAPGVDDLVFTRTSPCDGNSPLLAKRDSDEGGYFDWNYCHAAGQLVVVLVPAHDPQPGHVLPGFLTGWGYVGYAPTIVAMVYYDGFGMPGFQSGCNHTGSKKLLKAKSEAPDAREAAK
ncbi:hypothetical protein N657DRAFT_637460 [Parathielavia appendiculata]|uniref:Uncharacterized protein n=1 Tax=Parathielavia appendiculata TaxID=2587402 RepID=A0AAN6TSB8_9PEZI|nr:hypothetical protein N657DRAFT_637460 [Parathielavia appendiculata]